jgi:hypothetical protein
MAMDRLNSGFVNRMSGDSDCVTVSLLIVKRNFRFVIDNKAKIDQWLET